MRRNTTFSNTKVLKRGLKYAVLNKESKKISIYRYKTAVADLLGVSIRTLDRSIPYETDKYIVYFVSNVVF